MRALQVHQQIAAIRRRLGAGRRDIDRDALQQYAVDGTVPEDELTRQYIELSEAASRCMILSVGGSDPEREQAAEAYQTALERWNVLTKGVTA